MLKYTNTMKTKAVIYARVSSKEQEETGYSLEAQEKLLKDYSVQKEFDLVKVYKVTESASGKQIRKMFIEMVEFASKNGVTVILCEKIDRLTRNLKDAATASDWVLSKDAREIHFVKENFVVSKNTKAHENFVWDMKVAMARFYTNNLSEEVRKGQKEKIAQGGYPSKPPIGYKTVGDTGKKFHVIDPEKAPFIKKAYEYYVTGEYSMRALIDKLYKEGLRSSSGGKIVKSRMEDLLGDPFYYGMMEWNGSLYQGGHEPIISKEIFEKAQYIRSGKKARWITKHDFIFSKLITCEECKGMITAEKQKGAIYYHCNHYRNCSQQKYAPERVIESQITEIFGLFGHITPEQAEFLKMKIKERYQGEISYRENAVRELQGHYNALQRRLEVLYNDKLDGTITPQFWATKKAQIDGELKDSSEAITNLRDTEGKYFEEKLNILDLAFRAGEIYEKRSPEEKRQLIKTLFKNMTLDGLKLNFELVHPAQALSKRIKEKLEAEKFFEPQKTVVNKGQKGSFEPLCPAMLPR